MWWGAHENIICIIFYYNMILKYNAMILKIMLLILKSHAIILFYQQSKGRCIVSIIFIIESLINNVEQYLTTSFLMNRVHLPSVALFWW